MYVFGTYYRLSLFVAAMHVLTAQYEPDRHGQLQGTHPHCVIR